MDANDSPKTLLQAIRYYADLDRCQEILVEARWPNGVTCPTCGGTRVSYLATQKRWQCYGKHPRRQFSVKVGTIFEDSPIKLDKWFTAIWLIANAKNGISSYEIHRAIGVTQKTAWFMLHRIRLAMQTGSFERKMMGTVEVDETYVGGKIQNMHPHRQQRAKRSGTWQGKVAVMGMLERRYEKGTSQVRAKVVTGTKRKELYAVINENIEDQTTVVTDALPSYTSMNSRYQHFYIDHKQAYVDGLKHTNGIENFWSLLKRTIKGTYISVDPVHLFRYIEEQAFRFNNRKDNDAQRFAEVLDAVTGKRITYKELIGEQPA